MKLILGLVLAATLAACVDGGADAEGGATAPPVASIGDGVNRERADRGLAPLARSAQLSAAARRHLRDMRSSGDFSHTGSDGSSVADRVRAAGYCFANLGENISSGPSRPGGVIRQWMASSGHRANILMRGATDYGSASGGGMWVLVVARAC